MKFRSCAEWPKGTFSSQGYHTSYTHATKEQALAVCQMLRKEGAGGEGRSYPVKTWVEPLVTFCTIPVQIDDLEYVRIAAFDGSHYIGTVDVLPDGDRASFRQLFVLPSHRRQWVGTALINAVFQAAAMWGSNSVVCGVRKGNLTALKFYQHHGFLIAEEDENDWIMVKPLPKPQVKEAA